MDESEFWVVQDSMDFQDQINEIEDKKNSNFQKYRKMDCYQFS